MKREMNGVRWWVEGDVKGLFDTDKRFLHLMGQFLKARYVEDWRYLDVEFIREQVVI